MTASESLGYGLMGFGPALSMFALTIARHPSRVVVLLLSSFSWILSLALRKADHSLKLAALAGDAQLARSRAALAYASGLGFGVASGACSLLNPLADIADAGVPPGVTGTAKSIPESFIQASALTTGILTVQHTLWSVVAFQALCLQSTLLIAFPLVAHMFASGATLMYSHGHFGVSLAAIVGLLFLTAAVAFVVTGGQAGRAWSRLGLAQGSSSPEGSEHETA
ncbi:hypothetical protein MRX96_039494 [Rhipicephalus microplus]